MAGSIDLPYNKDFQCCMHGCCSRWENPTVFLVLHASLKFQVKEVNVLCAAKTGELLILECFFGLFENYYAWVCLLAISSTI